MLTAVAAVDVTVHDGVESLLCNIPWREGMTVIDATVMLRRFADVAVAFRGTGTSAFLTQLGHRSNQGPHGFNWMYKINGILGKCGIGSQVLCAEDHLEWVFELAR